MGQYTVVRTPAFDLLAADYARQHPKLEEDLKWLVGRLEEAPDLMGDHVPELARLALPVFKTRCKDSCHRIGASGAWRIYYALHKPAKLANKRRQCFAFGSSTKPIPLEQACEAILDTLHSDPIYADEGIACVRSPDIAGEVLNLTRALKTSESEYERRTVRGEPRDGDIVYCRQGGGTGRAAIVSNGDRFSLGQAMMLLRPDRRVIEPRYFLHQLLSPNIVEDQLEACFIGTASPRVNIGALRKFNLVLPPLPEQRRIVVELDALQAEVDALKRLQVETAAELDALLPAILDRAFKGEL